MAFKKLIAAAAVAALTSTGAFADTQSQGYSLDGGTVGTETLTFALPDASASALMLSFFGTATISNVSFSNGIDSLVIDVNGPNLWTFAPQSISAGNWDLTFDYNNSLSVLPTLGTAVVTYTPGTQVTAVPEPESYAMMLAGLGALGFMARRRKAK
jgi:hypothetical protein